MCRRQQRPRALQFGAQFAGYIDRATHVQPPHTFIDGARRNITGNQRITGLPHRRRRRAPVSQRQVDLRKQPGPCLLNVFTGDLLLELRYPQTGGLIESQRHRLLD
jgi:hypothetical protein